MTPWLGCRAGPVLERSPVVLTADMSRTLCACEDLDAPSGRFTYWALSGIDRSATRIDEGEPSTGAVVGVNGFGSPVGEARRPPAGDGPHRYLFTVFASSTPLKVASGAGADELVTRLEATLARGELIGTAER